MDVAARVESERTPAAVTPIISALVAAAARSGTPHQAISIGTFRMPPPMPSVPETTPGDGRHDQATGSRFTR